MVKRSTALAVTIIVVVIIAIVAGVCFLAPPTAKPQVELRVAAVLDTFVTEDGWNEAAYNGLMEAKKKFGDRIEVAYSEKIALADYERVMRDYAEKGFDLIFCHATPAGEAVKSVAKDYPNKWFVWTDGFGEIPSNVVVITPLAHEASYLAGMLAGGMTKTNKIGVVGGMNVPSTYRSFYAFKEGVKAINPQAEVREIWVGTFVDIHAGYEAARTLIDGGVDVIWGNGDSQNAGARFAAVEKKVWYIGGVWDENKYAPAVTLTSVLWGLDAAFVDMIGKALDKKLEPGKFYEYGMKEGATLASYHELEPSIPKDLRDKIEDAKTKILSGQLVVPRKDFPD